MCECKYDFLQIKLVTESSFLLPNNKSRLTLQSKTAIKNVITFCFLTLTSKFILQNETI